MIARSNGTVELYAPRPWPCRAFSITHMFRSCAKAALLAVLALCAVTHSAGSVPTPWPLVATQVPSGAAGAARRLLQTQPACNTSVPNCATCRYVPISASRARALCTACRDGYSVESAGRACCEWGADGHRALPGGLPAACLPSAANALFMPHMLQMSCSACYFVLMPHMPASASQQSTDPTATLHLWLCTPPGCSQGYYRSTAGVCSPCGYGYYCPGATTKEASAKRTKCGLFKNTTTLYASGDRDCGERARAGPQLLHCISQTRTCQASSPTGVRRWVREGSHDIAPTG